MLERSPDEEITLFFNEVCLRSKSDWERAGRPLTMHFVVTTASQQAKTLRNMRFV